MGPYLSLHSASRPMRHNMALKCKISRFSSALCLIGRVKGTSCPPSHGALTKKGKRGARLKKFIFLLTSGSPTRICGNMKQPSPARHSFALNRSKSFFVLLFSAFFTLFIAGAFTSIHAQRRAKKQDASGASAGVRLASFSPTGT